MKKILSFLGIMLLIGFFIGILTNLMPLRADEEDARQQLPDVDLISATGENYNLNEIDDLMILFFWLPKSDSCLVQLERLKNFTTENKAITILAIAIGDIDKKDLLNIKSDLALEFPLLIDQQAELARKLQLSTIPTTIIYHPQANNLNTIIGTYKQEELIKKLKGGQKK